MAFRDDWASGEVGGQLGTALLDWFNPEGGRTRRRVEEASGIERGDYMGYLDFLPDIFEQAIGYSTTGEEPPGPWSLDTLQGGGGGMIGPSYEGTLPTRPYLPSRRRRRRRGCAPGYRRVSSCRCQCKRKRKGRSRKGRMPAALKRYWAAKRRSRR